MGRAWIAFYMGDYQRDTNRLTTLEHGAYFLLLQECWTHGSIPPEPADRAALTKMTLREWSKIALKINAFFADDGTQKRATKEIEKAEVIRTKRAIAGFKGGTNSGISRAIGKGRQSKYEANAKQRFKQTDEQKLIPAEAIYNNNTINSSSEPVAAREKGPPEAEVVQLPPRTKMPNEMTKQELDDLYAAKREKAKPRVEVNNS